VNDDQDHIVQLTLADVARVQAGYLSRTRVEAASDGSHRLVQARDVSDRGEIDLETVVFFDPDRNPDLYRVTTGDILFIARGHDHRAHLIQTELVDTLASSVFHIIRPNRATVLPAYLAWWLNQPEAQTAIKMGSRGTAIGYVSRRHMESIPVSLPPRAKQQLIVDTIALWERRSRLQSQLVHRRQEMIQTLCRRAVRPEKEYQ
jgi:hypothetical protein